MKKVDFDEYAEKYDTLLQNQLHFFDEVDYFAEYKVKTIRSAIKKSPQKILEYGCGIGRNLRFLRALFPEAEIYGCDTSEKSIERTAKENPSVHVFLLGNDRSRHHEKFDLIVVANVLHHIPPEDRENTMSLLSEWLERDGNLFIFEHNPYNPVTRHLVNTCPFDEDAVLLNLGEVKSLLLKYGLRIISQSYILFFPSFLKRLRFLEKYLVHLPLGGQFFVHASKP